jgi:perosamine synthetase
MADVPRATVPVNEPLLGGNEARYVAECLEAGWISSEGRFVEAFEQAWADYCGAKFGVAVSNGTTALQLAMMAAQLPRGSEVIVPSFTIVSCVIAIIEAGLVPVLVDVMPDTWCLDPAQVRARVTQRTRAIMPVHMYGHPAAVDEIRTIAAEHGLLVVEDAAEAHGATAFGRRVGSFGDMSCFSFYANKILTTGEGGMVLTSSEPLRDRLRSGRNLAFRPERRFLHHEIGHNYRLTNLQAAVGLAQVERADVHVATKRRIGRRYLERLADCPGIRLPVEQPGYQNVFWMFGVVLEKEARLTAAECATRLRQEFGVETRPFFVGMHQQPVFLRDGLFMDERHPVTEYLAEYGFYLPTGLTLRDDQIDYCAQALAAVIGR